MALKTLPTKLQQPFDTAANWNASNRILLYGEKAYAQVSSGAIRGKTGVGTKKFSELPYDDEALYESLAGKASQTDLSAHMSSDTVHITSAERDKWNKGDTASVNGIQPDASGNITLNAFDVNADIIGSAKVVDHKIIDHCLDMRNPHNVTADQVGALPLSGGTMTGALTLAGSPADPADAVNRAYVDETIKDTCLYYKPVQVEINAKIGGSITCYTCGNTLYLSGAIAFREELGLGEAMITFPLETGQIPTYHGQEISIPALYHSAGGMSYSTLKLISMQGASPFIYSMDGPMQGAMYYLHFAIALQ